MLDVCTFSRYTNIIPYDDTRVQLQEAIADSDYINASWITRGSNDRSTPHRPEVSFIASQGPTKQSCVHHLQLIYENKVDIVVMLSNIMEGSGEGL